MAELTAPAAPPAKVPLASLPLMQRSGIKLTRGAARTAASMLAWVGRRALFFREIFRALSQPAVYVPETIRQMRVIGVDSLPLTFMVAAFIGSVVALQVRYQLFAGVELSVVALSVRQMVILELGPLLTGLVLTGRVGARMTAEIGTMRVTEQIDALETLAYDPVAFLIVPRLLAATLMLPTLTVIADAVGIGSGMLTSIALTDVTKADFMSGVRISFTTFQVIYSLIKATMFGAAIAFLCSFEGYTAEAGAEGVGRSTASAVVVGSVAVLILDALTALVLAPYLQG